MRGGMLKSPRFDTLKKGPSRAVARAVPGKRKVGITGRRERP